MDCWVKPVNDESQLVAADLSKPRIVRLSLVGIVRMGRADAQCCALRLRCTGMIPSAPDHGRRVCLHDAQQRFRSTARSAFTAFPFLKRAAPDAKGCSELRLGHT